MKWALAWTFYGLGDFCWRVNDFWLPECLWRQWLFDLYQWSMRVASDFQGDGPGPWLPVEDDTP